jgi:ribosomal protein L11 methyltransferase
MFSLEIECPTELRDVWIAELWEQGSAGIVEIDERRLRAFFEETADRAELMRRYPNASLRAEIDCDWVESARGLLQPMLVGSRFFLVPEWRDDAAPPGRFRIAVNPGMAFGTGVHETTQLCLEALEDYVCPGMAVLDVGAGSGILTGAAGLLGAAKLYACDIDPVAAAIARSRAPGTFVGSVNAVATAAADLVVANISPEAIVQLAPDLLRVRRPGGVLLASGFELPEIAEILAAMPGKRELRLKGNWALAVI